MNEQQQQRIKKQLDQSLDQLNGCPDITRRLSQARARAVGSSSQVRCYFRPVLAPVLALTLLVALLAPLVLQQPEDDIGISAVSTEDQELVDQLDMFEQDMEFYYWLDDVDAQG